jgi:serine/threonine-protein kinase
MAEVYLARRAGPHGFQKLVAVKRILPQYARDMDFLAMFVDEARVCARLAHPNIVHVFDFGDHEEELYMAMEFVEGSTVARLVRAAAVKDFEIPLEASLHIALSVLRGLEYAHGARDDRGSPLNLVHRDVSPGNVLLDRSGAVKLTDFGIARASEFERRTDAGQLKGKLGYMSPEQVIGRELDHRSDLFTLGIVLAEMVMLRPLFSGGRELDVLLRIRDADLSALDRAGRPIPDDVKAVLFRALAKERDHRYPSARAFAEAIEEIVRRRRLQVGPSKLAHVLEKLGLTQPDPHASGETASAKMGAVSTGKRSLPPVSEKSTGQSLQNVAPQIYRIRMTDEVLGPLSYPRVIELFATGEIGPKALISRESGPFKEATKFGEFSRFVKSPALRWDETLFFGGDRSNVDAQTLPSRLFRLALNRETGVLMLAAEGKRKKLYLVDGVPEFVASSDREELLGQMLVRRGQVLRMEVDMALAMLPKFNGRLGEALVGLGVLRPIELFRAIHEQTQERFVEVLGWRTGEMSFVRAARSQEETFPLGVDTMELIARGIHERYTKAELDFMFDGLNESLIEPVPHPALRIETLRLPEREGYVLRSITMPTTIDDLQGARARGIEPADVLRALVIGFSFELLVCEDWGGDKPTLIPEPP